MDFGFPYSEERIVHYKDTGIIIVFLDYWNNFFYSNHYNNAEHYSPHPHYIYISSLNTISSALLANSAPNKRGVASITGNR